MEEAAVHRMATSITQKLTLCQVSSEEIETVIKLLEKACHKFRGIPEVPPQQIIDLENATRQLRQLSHTLDSCTISASYEVSEAQKALLLLPRTEKGSSTSSEEHYANLPDPTHYDELQEHYRECPNDADAWKRTTEWILSGLWELEARPSILT